VYRRVSARSIRRTWQRIRSQQAIIPANYTARTESGGQTAASAHAIPPREPEKAARSEEKSMSSTTTSMCVKGAAAHRDSAAVAAGRAFCASMR
jgi:hypothetical protein